MDIQHISHATVENIGSIKSDQQFDNEDDSDENVELSQTDLCRILEGVVAKQCELDEHVLHVHIGSALRQTGNDERVRDFGVIRDPCHVSSFCKRVQMKQLLVLLVLFAPFCSADVWQGAVHGVGQLYCNEKPFANQLVEVWEKNFLWGDGLWGSTKTDKHGFFQLKAAGWEWFGPTQPYLFIPNFCESDGKCANNVINIFFPDIYISKDQFPKMKLDIGQMELRGFDRTEQRGMAVVLGSGRYCN
ncbi:unnamed protein product [Caenorhabditis sp. 36 PRJEB53466]|nr:unnamed protein product [Caenorhabditis sp. 36 PRJEB53466]